MTLIAPHNYKRSHPLPDPMQGPNNRIDFEVIVRDCGTYFEATAKMRLGVGSVTRAGSSACTAAQDAAVALVSSLIDFHGVAVKCDECNRPRKHHLNGKDRSARGFCLGVDSCLVRN